MKSRFGFVSNSSSTNFVILVKPEKAKAVEFILRHTNEEPCKAVPERRNELKKEIRELNKDVKHVNDFCGKVSSMTDKTFSDHWLLTKLHSFRNQIAIRGSRIYPDTFKPMGKEEYLGMLLKLREDLEKEKTDSEQQIKLLEGNDSWGIMTFKDDLNFGTLKEMVDDLVKNGDAIILIKKTT